MKLSELSKSIGLNVSTGNSWASKGLVEVEVVDGVKMVTEKGVQQIKELAEKLSKNKRQMTLSDRKSIEKMLKSGAKKVDIARAMNCSCNVISYEIKKCKGEYNAEEAHLNTRKGYDNPTVGKNADKVKKALDIICKSIREGYTNSEAAKLAGIRSETLIRWKKNSPEFKEKIAEAIAEREKSPKKRLLSVKKLLSSRREAFELICKLLREGKTVSEARKTARIGHKTLKLFSEDDEWKKAFDEASRISREKRGVIAMSKAVKTEDDEFKLFKPREASCKACQDAKTKTIYRSWLDPIVIPCPNCSTDKRGKE